MQKYDWRRLFSEVRPTFLPYARFTVRTRLLPEECRERLAAATQPQPMPTLVSARTSDDPRLIFKGQISKTGFRAALIGHRSIKAGSRALKPFLLFGRFRAAFGGTALAVQVLPDVCCFVVIGALLALVSWPIIHGRMVHDTFMELFLLARFFLFYGVLTLPASFEAYRAKKTLERLLA